LCRVIGRYYIYNDMKAIKLAAILSFVAIAFSSGAMAQQKKIPKNPFKFRDAVTGKPIPEVLVLPRYRSAKGIFLAPEGPAKGTHRNYLDKPFVYRTGAQFILKTPKFRGLPLPPVLIGEGADIEGIMIVAPRYRPMWFDDLWRTRDIWNTRDIRDLRLTPIPDKEWSVLLEKKLNPLTDESVLSVDDFQFWRLYEADPSLYIDYDKDERELIRRFLQAATTKPAKRATAFGVRRQSEASTALWMH
jgi:hypothetical protein